MATQMESEFREMTGVAKKSNESRAQYLERVYGKVRDLSDDEWERLTPKAQQWFNDAGKAGKNQDLPDFPDVESGPTDKSEGVEKPESEDTMAASAPKKKKKAVTAKPAKAAAKPAKAVAKKASAKKATNGNGTAKGALRASGTAVLKRALLKNPSLDDKALSKICKDEGYKLSPFSIAARKADFLHTIKLLQTDGRLKD